MQQPPTTDEIVTALLTLGVEGPAEAADVLAATRLWPLPETQVPEVYNALVIAQAQRRNGQATS